MGILEHRYSKKAKSPSEIIALKRSSFAPVFKHSPKSPPPCQGGLTSLVITRLLVIPDCQAPHGEGISLCPPFRFSKGGTIS